eukprot:TRINITY_DN8373_c0_g1_i1.p1 TRINITY_DN8373_c0_g1~~TRINITY_DN8373_c0_g1_i1.p1  ORF type:complete len:722 (+),score=144.73 TRINITY_DN8373_c0_g1_i1:22-2187(+)
MDSDLESQLQTRKLYKNQIGTVKDISRNNPEIEWITEEGRIEGIFLNFSGVTQRLRVGAIVRFDCHWNIENEYWEALNIRLAVAKRGYIGFLAGSQRLVAIQYESKKTFSLTSKYSTDIKLEVGDHVEFYPGLSAFASNEKYAYLLTLNGSGIVASLCSVGSRDTGVYIKWRPCESKSKTTFEKVFYQFQHDLEKEYVLPGLSATFVPFFTKNRKGQGNLMVQFGSFTCITPATVIRSVTSNLSGTVRFDKYRDTTIDFQEEDIICDYHLPVGSQVELKFFGDKKSDTFHRILVPVLKGTIYFENRTMKIETEDNQVFDVEEKYILGNFPLLEDDKVTFKLDENTCAVDIMINLVVRGVCKRKGFFTIRNMQIPYPTNQNVNINDVADVKLKWENHFLTVSKIVQFVSEPVNNLYDYSPRKDNWDNYQDYQSDSEESDKGTNSFQEEKIENKKIKQKVKRVMLVHSTDNLNRKYTNKKTYVKKQPKYKKVVNKLAKSVDYESQPVIQCEASELLENLSFPQYLQKLVGELGVEKYEDFDLIAEEEWKEALVKPIHKRRILKAASEKLRSENTPNMNTQFHNEHNSTDSENDEITDYRRNEPETIIISPRKKKTFSLPSQEESIPYPVDTFGMITRNFDFNTTNFTTDFNADFESTNFYNNNMYDEDYFSADRTYTSLFDNDEFAQDASQFNDIFNTTESEYNPQYDFNNKWYKLKKKDSIW